MGQFAGTTFGIGTPSIYSAQQNPFGGGYGVGPYGIGAAQPWQQIAQLLQIVPQQLQQLQLLQQHQLQQLQQLQQLIQVVVPHQLQQLQQQIQPFSAGVSGPLGFGLAPQLFAGQPSSHVM
jgi:hypothetical protein